MNGLTLTDKPYNGWGGGGKSLHFLFGISVFPITVTFIADPHIFVGDPPILVGNPRFSLETPDFCWGSPTKVWGLKWKFGGLQRNVGVYNGIWGSQRDVHGSLKWKGSPIVLQMMMIFPGLCCSMFWCFWMLFSSCSSFHETIVSRLAARTRLAPETISKVSSANAAHIIEIVYERDWEKTENNVNNRDERTNILKVNLNDFNNYC